MSDQEQQAEESAAPPASTDSDTVQDALQNMPGLAESMGNRPAARTGSDDAMEEEPDPDTSSFGTAPEPVEDSETVQQARKQLGL